MEFNSFWKKYLSINNKHRYYSHWNLSWKTHCGITHILTSIIWDALLDLVPFLYNFKNVKNTHGGVIFLVKLLAEACNFTKSNSPPWVFFTLFKLYKLHQFAQGALYLKVCKKWSIFGKIFCQTKAIWFKKGTAPFQ